VRLGRSHPLALTPSAELPFALKLDSLWRGATGRPTTPLDLQMATLRFNDAVGRVNSQRLPSEHRLDLRLSRAWQVSRTTLRAFVGVDNLYKGRSLEGFDLLELRTTTATPDKLAEQRGLGREIRWSVELSW